MNGVIVSADDLGLSPGVTAGILEAHRSGVVRSTSLLVTFDGAADAAALARQERGLEIGIHLDLVGGRPVTDPTHLLPPLNRVVATVARQEGARYLRRARPPRIAATAKAQLLGAASIVSSFLQRGVPGNDWFVDLTALPKRPDAATVALYAAYPGIGELVGHPGRPDDALRATGDSLVLKRFDDLQLLTDPLLRSALGDTIRWRVEQQ